MKTIILIILIALGMILLVNSVNADTLIGNVSFCSVSNKTMFNVSGVDFKQYNDDNTCGFYFEQSEANRYITNVNYFDFPNAKGSSWYCMVNMSVNALAVSGRGGGLMNGSTGSNAPDSGSGRTDIVFALGNSCSPNTGRPCILMNTVQSPLIVGSSPDVTHYYYNVTWNGTNLTWNNILPTYHQNFSLVLPDNKINYYKHWIFLEPIDLPRMEYYNLTRFECWNSTTGNIAPIVTLNFPSDNSIFHNTSIKFNFTIIDNDGDKFNYTLWADANSNPTTLINSSLNTTDITISDILVYRFLDEIAGSINGTYYWKINGTDNTNRFLSSILAFNITNNINLYNATNVTLNSSPINNGKDTLRVHFNLTNKAGQNDTINMSEIRWFINGSLVTTATNNTILNSPNVTLDSNITAQVRVNNGFGTTSWTEYVNSTTSTVGDITLPTITNQTINGNSFTTSQRVNFTVNCTDDNSVNSVKVESNRTNIFANDTMNLLAGNVYSFDSLFAQGNYNITAFYCADGSGNIARDLSNFTISVTSPSGDSGSSGGGGGGGTQIIIVQNVTNLTTIIPNCDFNQICGSGEDPFGCPTDCKINTNYLFCDDPTKKCIKNTISEAFDLFNARNPVFRLSVIIALLSVTLIFIPKESNIGKIFKKPFIKKGTR